MDKEKINNHVGTLMSKPWILFPHNRMSYRERPDPLRIHRLEDIINFQPSSLQILWSGNYENNSPQQPI